MQNVRSGVKIIFADIMLILHLSHKGMRWSFSERRVAHNDTWDLCCHFGDELMERTEISAYIL